MMNMVLLYIVCQLVIQGMAYSALDYYLNFPIKRVCERNGISKRKAKTIYMALGQIENFAITAVVVLVTARASMVGTANLMASAILSIIIALEAQIIFIKYDETKAIAKQTKKRVSVLDI